MSMGLFKEGMTNIFKYLELFKSAHLLITSPQGERMKVRGIY